MILPYTDSSMVWNNVTKRYTLTLECVQQELGIDLVAVSEDRFISDKNIKAQQTLDKISIMIYQYIYSFNSNNKFQRYLLHRTVNARTMLKEAMKYQLLYFMNNGDINGQSWVSLSHQPDIEDIRNRAISPYAIQALMPTVEGYRLLFTGSYGYYFDISDESGW